MHTDSHTAFEETYRMAMPPPLPPDPPLFIRLGMWGLSSRIAALVCLWCCVGLGALCLLLTLITPWAVIGAVYFFPFAWWNWAVIRWVDKNNGRWLGFRSLSR
jgi:hypothetical protein